MSSNLSNPAVNLYSQGGGTASSAQFPSSPVIQTRDPASTDIKGAFGLFPIGQTWVNTARSSTYMLSAFSSSGGVVSATWVLLSAGSGDLDALAGDSGTATPSAGVITVAGGSGVVTSASGSTVTVSLTGGGTAIDSFVPDTGTSPVVPDGTGSITMSGTLNQITTTGGLNSLTFSLPSEIQSGSVTAIGGLRHFTSVGTGAASNITATDTTAIGFGALANNTAIRSTAVGSGALGANVGGTGNTAVGYIAAASNTGNQNTAVGHSALNANTSGADSTAVGYRALASNTGTGNSALGSEAGGTNTSGTGLTAVGFQSLTASTGDNNTALGYTAGIGIAAGSANTLLGAAAATGLTTGNSNVIVGQNAGSLYGSTESGNIVIGQGVTGTASENNVTRIGTQGTQTKCVVAGIFGVTVGGSGIAVDVDNTGQLGTVVSSIRYKDQVKDIEGTERIYDLHPVSFVYKNVPEVRRYGLIAEEAAEVIPEMAVYGNGGTLETVRYADLPIFLLSEIQKLRAEIDDLKAGL